MNKLLIAFSFLIAMSLSAMAAENPAAGTESGPQGAGPPGYQSWPGHVMTQKEQAPEQHVSAAAAHEQAASHHRAAAALQAGDVGQAREHALAAEKSAAKATEMNKTPTVSVPRN